MEQSTIKETSSSAKINPDLADAKQIITITLVAEAKRAELAEAMETQFLDLDKGYTQLTVEEKLFLLSLALNLMLYAYQTKKIGIKQKYKYKILRYSNHLFTQLQTPLTDLQKAKWSAEIAKLHRLCDYRNDAHIYYKEAIGFTQSAKHKTPFKRMLLDFTTQIAEINAECVTYYETKLPAPDLAYEANENVIIAANTALKLVPDQTLAVQLYVMKTQALVKLAARNYQLITEKAPIRGYSLAAEDAYYKHKTEKTIKLWIKALETASTGWSITKLPEDQNRFRELLKACSQALWTLVTQSSEKENFSSMVADIKKINIWLEDGMLANIRELQQFVSAVSQTITPVSKPTPFWQKPAQAKQNLLEVSKGQRESEHKPPAQLK